MKKSATFLLTMFCATLFLSTSVHAQIIFAHFGGTQRTDGGKVVGASFSSFGQTISSLGFYDFGADGLAGSYSMGLWDASQTLIATATVTPASVLIGDFRYAPITPVTIGTFAVPQTFTIGALLPASMPDVWLDNSILALGVGYAGAGTGQFATSGSLVYPATLDSSPYVVVNAGPVVPEPCGLAVPAVAGATMLARRRKPGLLKAGMCGLRVHQA